MVKRKLYFNPITGEFRFDRSFGEFSDIPAQIHWKPDDEIIDKEFGFKNLTLNLTMNCNLRCKYCWQNHNCAPDMTTPVIDKWLDFFLDEKRNSPKKILYFGGEPLLRIDLIKYAAELVDAICRNRGISKPKQQIFTNATMISQEVIELIQKEDIYLILSIDGDDEYNSAYRVDANGNSVQVSIREGVQRLKQSGIRFGVCSTMSDIDFDVDKTIRYIIEEIEPSSYEFNVRYDRNFMKKYPDTSLLSFSSFFESWDLIRKSGVENINFRKRILPLALKNPLRNSSSGSKNKLAIMPDGKVSPFNSAIQFPELQIAPVGDWLSTFKKQWNRNLLFNERCKKCPAAFICGQGSAFSSYLEFGDFDHTPFLHCEYCLAILEYIKKTLITEFENTASEEYTITAEDIRRVFNI